MLAGYEQDPEGDPATLGPVQGRKDFGSQGCLGFHLRSKDNLGFRAIYYLG
jgi:hypothetical protein